MLNKVQWAIMACFPVLLSTTPSMAQIDMTRHDIATFDEGFWLVTKDFDADGDVDIIAISGATDGIKWYENNGSGSFSSHEIASNYTDAWSVDAGDLDGDGDMDVVACAATGGAEDKLSWFEQFGDGSFQEHVLENEDDNPHSVWIGDIDNDGDNDILVGVWGIGELQWWQNDGQGGFSRNTIDNNFGSVHHAITADMDNDGDEDIIGAGAGKTYYYDNNGSGGFTRSQISGNGGFGVEVADIDGDGLKDIIRIARDYKLDWFENNGGGSFSYSIIKDVFGEGWAAAAGDFDRDGDIDIAAAAYVYKDISETKLGPDYISLFENNNESFSEDVLETFGSESGKRPRIVSAADVDGDGDDDLVALITREDDLIWYEQPGSPVLPDSVRITAPNGGQTIDAGSTVNITWYYQGNVSTVDLELSTDNGTSWSTIASGLTAEDGTYAWTVPDSATSIALVRVTDAANSTTKDASDGTFTITGLGITVTAPNGGETWFGTENEDITWTTTGSIDNVKLEYSKDAGSTWTEIVASTPNDGSYEWTIPHSIDAGSALVRASSVGAVGDVSDITDAVFSISQTFLKITFPNGGEDWVENTTDNITWSSSLNVGNVKLEYWLESTGTWTEIEASTANNGSYSWTAPNLASADNALIRISEAADGSPSDSSDATFSVSMASITLTSPNGGEYWGPGESKNITWTNTGSLTNIKIEFSSDNGSTWSTVESSTANNPPYTWVVPDSITTNGLIRVSDADAGLPSDHSDAVFTIGVSTLQVTVPNGGETWDGGVTSTITWNTTGGVQDVKLEYSTNGGANWSTIIGSTPNDGTHPWTVPNVATTSALVRISDASDGIPLDDSDAMFEIVQSGVDVTSPATGTEWIGGTTQSVTWNTTGTVNSVNLYYKIHGSSDSTVIATNITNTGSFSWQLPDIDSDSVMVYVENAADATQRSASGFFAIQRVGITVSSPNGGETAVGGTLLSILWTSEGPISSVTLEYSTNNGATWKGIATGMVNDGDYYWTVPDIHTTEALVRVTSSDGMASDASDSVFQILLSPTITVTVPNGGETWDGGVTSNITWNTTGVVQYVKLEYSTNGGANWSTIIGSTPNDGTHPWTVPNVATTSALVRISDASDGVPLDDSDAVFEIALSGVDVTAPATGTEWIGGTTQSVTWNTTGTVNSVNLYYKLSGSSDSTVIATNIANSGSYGWQLPDINSDSVMVFVENAADATQRGASGYFTILRMSITVLSPNGGEISVIGTIFSILWTSEGPISTVKLEYSTNNGATWKGITSGVVNDGDYYWNVPDVHTTEALVRVTSTDGMANDVSDATFTIQSVIAGVDIAKADADIPDQFELLQNFPNPFNPSTTIRFGLPQQSQVKVQIFNNLGMLVGNLVDAEFAAGSYNLEWDAGNLPSGMYFYRIEALPVGEGQPFVQTKRLSLIK